MRRHLVGSGFVAGLVLGTGILLRAPAQDAPRDAAAPAVRPAPEVVPNDPFKPAGAPSKPDERKPESKTGQNAKYSPGVDEILNMVQAGVSAEVIKTYIESSPVAYNLSPTDIITLKEHAVPDELTTALMMRGAALRLQVQQSTTPVGRPPPTRPYYRLDPESYDYFQYHYLYPRTLAAANQSFYSSGTFSPGFAPYGYGYYQPPAFWPWPPSAFGRP